MTRSTQRLFRPKSIAVIGGGAWCHDVIKQAVKMGFTGDIWPVHPKQTEMAGYPAFAKLNDLPNPPDAVFIGVNRKATVELVGALAQMGAGGAVCFASGFSEAAAEDEAATDLQRALIAAAGDMPILGPNCYGFINALDSALLWPDQHGCTPVESGVAILTQSSNIAINLTMQQRALPIAYVVTCGNMAQMSQAQIAADLIDDPRVTAVGLHIEGFSSLRDWEALAQKAHERGIPLVALKVGASDLAQQATVSHTASLAGSDAGAQALLDRLGIPRLRSLPDLLETLKLLHCTGGLDSARLASISCSGGEASLIADMAVGRDITFPPLTQTQQSNLSRALGPMVALSNPLDYHTYVWRDADAMTDAWSALTGNEIAMTLSIVDYPTTDPTDWTCATQAALRSQSHTGAQFGVVATLPELMPTDVAQSLMAGGVVPFMGLHETLSAVEAAANVREPQSAAICLPGEAPPTLTLTETASKAALVAHGVIVPKNSTVSHPSDIAHAISDLQPPFAVKGVGMAHKSEHDAVRLHVNAAQIAEVISQIDTQTHLIEEMVEDGIVELLIGVTRDPAHGFVLTIGAGGTLTEILADARSLLVPASDAEVTEALAQLRIAPLLHGYRGKPAVDFEAILSSVRAVQSYVIENAAKVSEVEINPLICTPTRAFAADALIRKA